MKAEQEALKALAKETNKKKRQAARGLPSKKNLDKRFVCEGLRTAAEENKI